MTRPAETLVVRIVALLLLAIPGSFVTLSAAAEEPDSDIELVVVEGERPLTATSTTTVPAADYELRPLESGGQMLESVPGVLTAQHTGGGKAEQYFLRGFDADHGTDLAVYFDGVPINLRSHAHGQGYLDLHFVTKETIERLDVAKGTYSARYGDFTTAGKIDFVPFVEMPDRSVRAEVGSWDTYRVVGIHTPKAPLFGETGPNADGFVSIEAYYTDGPFENEENLGRVSLFGKGHIDPTPSLRLSGHLVGYAAEWDASGLIPERLVDDDEISRFGSLDPTEGGDTRRVQGKLQLDWEPDDTSHLLANAYVAHYELDLFSNFTFALADPAGGDGIRQHDDRIYAGGRVEYTKHFYGASTLQLRSGLEWRYDDARVRLGTQTQRDATGRTSDDDLWELSIGPYVETEWLPVSWVRLLAGVRFEQFVFDVESRLDGVDDFDGHDEIWLPKANLVLSPFALDAPFESDIDALETLELYLNYGTGFHSNDVRSASEDDDILARAHGAEVGIRSQPFDRLSLSLVGFWLQIDKELTFVGDEGTTEAGGRTRRLGLEFATHATLTDWLFFHGDVAYTSARFTSGNDPIAQSPRFVAKGALSARAGGWVAEFSVRSLGSRYASEDFRSPKLSGYTVFDLGARYREDALEFGFAIENLTGTRWRSSEFFFASCAPSEVGAVAACPGAGGGDGVEDFHYTPGNPRTARVWVRYSY